MDRTEDLLAKWMMDSSRLILGRTHSPNSTASQAKRFETVKPPPPKTCCFKRSNLQPSCFTHPSASTHHTLLAGITVVFRVRCHCSLVADVAECFTKKPAEVLVCIIWLLLVMSRLEDPKLIDLVIHLKNYTFEKSNRTYVPRRTKPKDIAHISNISRDDEFYHDESNGLQPDHRRGRRVVREEQWVTVTMFINGLKDDLKGEVSLHHL
ncbi:hypothetical protein Cgig2_017193 [Carnegiea gigantea]|uniref:Uncharacterized protein n=1 Tax=Carnegiea gigantea TaxID=171969 RepID=A0A9Q1JTZ2_9CARY|nr:hypothetical protein Cgig2_017193 [Carnegiea gigantea]